MSQLGGIFGGHENLAIGWKSYFSQKRLPQMCDHPTWTSEKMSKSQVGGILGGHENLAICLKCYSSQKRLPQYV